MKNRRSNVPALLSVLTPCRAECMVVGAIRAFDGVGFKGFMFARSAMFVVSKRATHLMHTKQSQLGHRERLPLITGKVP